MKPFSERPYRPCVGIMLINEDNKGSTEIFADENGNGEYDEGEFFIDTADGLSEIDTYYYEISTFSESYKNITQRKGRK